MREIKQVFARNLGQKLAEKIFGKVSVKIYDDEIHVNIQCWTDMDCEIVLNNFTNRIINGYSTDYAAYEVLEQYRKIVMRKYFK